MCIESYAFQLFALPEIERLASTTITVVPLSPDLISNVPCSCRTLSCMPWIVSLLHEISTIHKEAHIIHKRNVASPLVKTLSASGPQKSQISAHTSEAGKLSA